MRVLFETLGLFRLSPPFSFPRLRARAEERRDLEFLIECLKQSPALNFTLICLVFVETGFKFYKIRTQRLGREVVLWMVKEEGPPPPPP